MEIMSTGKDARFVALSYVRGLVVVWGRRMPLLHGACWMQPLFLASLCIVARRCHTKYIRFVLGQKSVKKNHTPTVRAGF